MRKKLFAAMLTLSLIAQTLSPVSAAAESRTIKEGTNTLTYAPGENVYYLNTTDRAAYAMKLGPNCELTLSCELYSPSIDNESFSTYVFPGLGRYEFSLLDEDGEDMTKSGSFTLYVESRPVLSDIEVKLKPEFKSGVPNSYDYIVSAFDVTALYADETKESTRLDGTLKTDYYISMDIVNSDDEEDSEAIDYEDSTGPAWLMVSCDTGNIVKFLPITLIDSEEYEASQADDDKSGSSTGSGSKKPGAASGSSNTKTKIVEGNAFKLNASSIPLKTGQSTQKVKASVLGRGDRIVSWKSNKPKIVKVTNSGKITARNKTGKAILTAKTAKGLKATLKVTVQRGPVKTKKISGVPKSLKLKKGQKKALSPKLTPLTTSQKLTYKSSNKKVATVSAKGVILAKKAGKTTITIRSGSRRVTCRVSVKK